MVTSFPISAFSNIWLQILCVVACVMGMRICWYLNGADWLVIYIYFLVYFKRACLINGLVIRVALFLRRRLLPSPFFHPPNLFSTPIEFIKIYIGQLPLELEEQQLRDILLPLAEIKELKIIKGDSTRGRYDLFCYAFVTMRGNEQFALDIIRHLQQRFPSWRMNVKYDERKPVRPRPFVQPPFPAPYPPNPYYAPPRPYYPAPVPPPAPASSDPQTSQKPCNILVRQLWIGGIPEGCEKTTMSPIMCHYGIIEEIEMFAKFAFVKYKQVSEATTALQRAEEISEKLGHPAGFRIFFSDPVRRANIVSNNYEYDRQSPSLPILFLGFPPTTSATIDMAVMRPICEKYGPIVGEYLNKSTNGQHRSYFLFTFDSVKTALRAKQELSKRKDILGDKRAEVALLLDETVIMKGHDLSHTEKKYQGEGVERKKGLGSYYEQKQEQVQQPPPMYYPHHMYPPQPYPQHFYPPMPYYYDPNNYYKPPEHYPPIHPHMQPHHMQPHQQQQPIHHQEEDSTNIHQFLKDVLADKDNGNEKKPVKSGEGGREEDILSKLLGRQAKLDGETKVDKKEEKQQGEKGEEREPSWSGFLTWKGVKRVGVDGHSSLVEPNDFAINILSLIEFKDIVLKQRNSMILQPSNSTGVTVFREYVKQLRSKVGVAMNTQFLMYIMGKSEDSDQIEPINDNELLVVFEKAAFLTQIKDKLIKCEELA